MTKPNGHYHYYYHGVKENEIDAWTAGLNLCSLLSLLLIPIAIGGVIHAPFAIANGEETMFHNMPAPQEDPWAYIGCSFAMLNGVRLLRGE